MVNKSVKKQWNEPSSSTRTLRPRTRTQSGSSSTSTPPDSQEKLGQAEGGQNTRESCKKDDNAEVVSPVEDQPIQTRTRTRKQSLTKALEADLAKPLDEGMFFVHSIMTKKVDNGKEHYFMRWEGFGPEYDSWEPKEQMESDCPLIVEEFEKQWKLNTDTTPAGFARGLPAMEIVGRLMSTLVGEEGKFIVRWVGCHEADLMSIAECKERIPHLVDKFFEDRRYSTQD